MKNIKNFLTAISMITFGLIVLLLIYYRFIQERLPNAFVDMTEYQKICLIITTIGIGISLLVQIRDLYKNKNKNSFLQKIKTLWIKLTDKLYSLLEEIYCLLLILIEKYILNPYKILIVITRFIGRKQNWFTNNFVIIIFEILPKILFHLALMVDVIYLNTFFYSYKYIALLLIPYITKFLVFVLLDFYANYFEYSNSMVNIEKIILDGKEQTILSFKDEFQDCGFNINYFVTEHLLVIAKIPDIILKYNTLKFSVLIFKYADILFSTIKLVLFIYVLYSLDFTFIYEK
jgi:hypothetical protein